jgi:hypothetical protein
MDTLPPSQPTVQDAAAPSGTKPQDSPNHRASTGYSVERPSALRSLGARSTTATPTAKATAMTMVIARDVAEEGLERPRPRKTSPRRLLTTGALFFAMSPLLFSANCIVYSTREVACLEAMAKLEECCPNFDASEQGLRTPDFDISKLNCDTVLVREAGCETDAKWRTPVTTVAESACIEATSCEALRQRGVCERVMRVRYRGYDSAYDQDDHDQLPAVCP